MKKNVLRRPDLHGLEVAIFTDRLPPPPGAAKVLRKNKKKKNRRILLASNPVSGKRRWVSVGELARRMMPPPYWQVEHHVLRGPGDLEKICKRARQKNYWAVVVAGGDGTLNSAVGALAGGRTRLGLIPEGTGNGFARGLGIPLDPESALAVISRGQRRRVDVALVNGEHYFINVAGVGFDARVAKLANRLRPLSRVSGFLRYFTASLYGAFTFRPRRVRITTGGGELESECLLLAIANGPQYGLGFGLAPSAKVDDGRLDLILLRPLGPIELIRNIPRLLTGRPLVGAVYLRARRFRIEMVDQESLPIHLEGEIIGSLPATVEVIPKAIRFLVP